MHLTGGKKIWFTVYTPHTHFTSEFKSLRVVGQTLVLSPTPPIDSFLSTYFSPSLPLPGAFVIFSESPFGSQFLHYSPALPHLEHSCFLDFLTNHNFWPEQNWQLSISQENATCWPKEKLARHIDFKLVFSRPSGSQKIPGTLLTTVKMIMMTSHFCTLWFLIFSWKSLSHFLWVSFSLFSWFAYLNWEVYKMQMKLISAT